jgi:hypothetical protein
MIHARERLGKNQGGGRGGFGDLQDRKLARLFAPFYKARLSQYSLSIHKFDQIPLLSAVNLKEVAPLLFFE